MKAAFIFAITLCLSAVMSIEDLSMLAQIESKMNPIRLTNTGKFLMDMAQMHAETHGALGTI